MHPLVAFWPFTPFRREALYESSQLSKEVRDSAALLASKVYYYLGEYDEALSFALGAGNAFEAESRKPESAEYVETVVCAFSSTGLLESRTSTYVSLFSEGYRQIYPVAV